MKRAKRTAASRYQGNLLAGAISGIITMILVVLGLYQAIQIIIYLTG